MFAIKLSMKNQIKNVWSAGVFDLTTKNATVFQFSFRLVLNFYILDHPILPDAWTYQKVIAHHFVYVSEPKAYVNLCLLNYYADSWKNKLAESLSLHMTQ